MNDGQTKFYDFILQRVKPENMAHAGKLLMDCFELQQQGLFNESSLYAFERAILEDLNPMHIQEVKEVMHQFGNDDIAS